MVATSYKHFTLLHIQNHEGVKYFKFCTPNKCGSVTSDMYGMRKRFRKIREEKLASKKIQAVVASSVRGLNEQRHNVVELHYIPYLSIAEQVTTMYRLNIIAVSTERHFTFRVGLHLAYRLYLVSCIFYSLGHVSAVADHTEVEQRVTPRQPSVSAVRRAVVLQPGVSTHRQRTVLHRTSHVHDAETSTSRCAGCSSDCIFSKVARNCQILGWHDSPICMQTLKVKDEHLKRLVIRSVKPRIGLCIERCRESNPVPPRLRVR